jgi:hypothetical protein
MAGGIATGSVGLRRCLLESIACSLLLCFLVRALSLVGVTQLMKELVCETLRFLDVGTLAEDSAVLLPCLVGLMFGAVCSLVQHVGPNSQVKMPMYYLLF